MKDHRFTELLNLYIDRQITAAETAELETELQGNPKRQAVYRQYCKIHTATKQVYDSFRLHSVDGPAAESGRAGVIELFENRRRRTNWTYYAGGLAAAACLALVFMRNNPAAPAEAPLLAAKPQPVLVAAATQPTPVAEVPPAARTTESATTQLLSLSNASAISPDYSAMLAALREQDEERAFSNGRLYVSGTQSLFGDEVFSTKQVLPAQEQRVFQSRPANAGQTQAEFSAFQFQR